MDVIIIPECANGEIISGEDRMLACPGEAVQYSCQDLVPTVTWFLVCPERGHPFTPSRLIDNSTTIREQFTCSNAEGADITFDVVVNTFTLNDNETYSSMSNISIEALSSNYPKMGYENLKIDCDGTMKYKVLNFSGIAMNGVYILSSEI